MKFSFKKGAAVPIASNAVFRRNQTIFPLRKHIYHPEFYSLQQRFSSFQQKLQVELNKNKKRQYKRFQEAKTVISKVTPFKLPSKFIGNGPRFIDLLDAGIYSLGLKPKLAEEHHFF